MRAKCPAYIFLLDFIVIIICAGEYILFNSLLCSFQDLSTESIIEDWEKNMRNDHESQRTYSGCIEVWDTLLLNTLHIQSHLCNFNIHPLTLFILIFNS
jgi:hypothetical protein